MGEGVVVCDRDGRIILANPAAEDVFPDVDEATYAEILAELEDPEHEAPVLGRAGGPVELRARRGDERWIEVSTWPVRADGDADLRDETIVILRDVTEARQRQAVRDTFIGVLSHELRTPVTTIYAGAKVLSRPGELPAETRTEIFGDIVDRVRAAPSPRRGRRGDDPVRGRGRRCRRRAGPAPAHPARRSWPPRRAAGRASRSSSPCPAAFRR